MNMKTKSISGEWLVFLGAFFWSLNAPLVKFIHMDPLLVCGLRSLIAGIVLFPLIRVKKLKINLWMLLYIVSYICLCMGIILSLSYTSAAIAIGMQYGSIIWIFIGNTILTRKFSTKRFIPVVLIIFGVIFFMFSGLQDGNTFGNLIALTESISFALMTISAQRCSGENPLGLTAIANLITGLFTFLFLPPAFSDLLILSGREWIVMLILGVVQVGLGYGFYNMGVLKTTAQKAAIISLWEMILGPIWVALFLKEYPLPLVLIGFIIIIVGLIANSLVKD